jgi:hypothetical protein
MDSPPELLDGNSLELSDSQALRVKLLEYQKDFLLSWRSQTKQELPPLHGGTLLALGGGVGFPAKSILYALAPDAHAVRRMVSQWLEHAFPDHRHLEGDLQATPRTVKLACWEDTWYDMGWVELEIQGPENLARIVGLLAAYGNYAGVGIKTALGMGGNHRPLREAGKSEEGVKYGQNAFVGWNVGLLPYPYQ